MRPLPIVLVLTVVIAGVSATTAQNPGYLRDFPSAERVFAEIKGKDAMDTAARQRGAFWQLKKIIEELSGFRWTRNELTPDEKRLMGEYTTGYMTAGKPYEGPAGGPKWY